MTEASLDRRGGPKPLRVFVAVIVAAVACLAVGGPVAYWLSGKSGLAAAALASGCCCVGALGALGVALWLRGPRYLLASVLVGMGVRMGVALGAALIVQLGGGPLVDVGFVYYLLMFYLVTLAVETTAVVRP
jgi:hypothetical protein